MRPKRAPARRATHCNRSLLRKGQRGSVWTQAALCSILNRDRTTQVVSKQHWARQRKPGSLGVHLLAGTGHDYGPPVSKFSSPSAAFHFSGVLGTITHPMRIRLDTSTPVLHLTSTLRFWTQLQLRRYTTPLFAASLVRKERAGGSLR